MWLLARYQTSLEVSNGQREVVRAHLTYVSNKDFHVRFNGVRNEIRTAYVWRQHHISLFFMSRMIPFMSVLSQILVKSDRGTEH